jgi:hypothetical protein
MRRAPGPLCFRIASEPWEFEQIARLNYATFVEEIPQHPPDESRRLVDRFHDQNTYAVAVRERQVVGMVAARGQRPFSLDAKLPDLDQYLPPGRRACEIRLLATRRDARGGGRVFAGLLRAIAAHGLARGYDLAVISGTTRQLALYRHLGFVPFGPLVGTARAMFQPMYVTLEALRGRAGHVAPELLDARGRAAARRTTSFLPGPVDVSDAVRAALRARPVSHRGRAFRAELAHLKAALRALTGASHVQVLAGSGTLATTRSQRGWRRRAGAASS